ncbi:hypothetical protein L7F22_030429 [Adiantum nelumboides]|nr:hypothetical protein [Adiantum nelumboides]
MLEGDVLLRVYHLLLYISIIVKHYLSKLVQATKVSQGKDSLNCVGIMAEEGKLKIEKSNGKNYQHWKMQIEDYVYQKDLYLPLGGLAKKPATMAIEAWIVLDQKALGTIRLSLKSLVAFNILEMKTIVDLMKSLDSLYKKPLASNKVFLMKCLFNIKMEEYLNDFNANISQL